MPKTSAPKSASAKPKGPHPSTLHTHEEPREEPTWSGSRLPATFEWDFPARVLPTRRDTISEECSDAMDHALVDAIRASYAQPGPGAPSGAMLEAQSRYHQSYGAYLHHNIAANGIHVSCGRGCSRCCHHFVTSVHALEVLAVYENLRKRPNLEAVIQECRKRLEDFEGWTEFCVESYPDRTAVERDDLVLEHYYDEGNPCPFLEKDGACGVYDDRPMTCRMYLATSPKEFCEPENVTADDADIFTLPADESVATRLERLDRVVDYWGHSPDLFRSLVRLHEWRTRWTPL
jgi:Fe-S-cluster containining protein